MSKNIKASNYKNILLIATGASPQVLTETLYAIHKADKPFPDKVIAITTESTKQMLTNGLFRDGRLAQLKEQYDLPDLQMTEDDIYLISDENGRYLDKGNTEKDQEAMADFITRIVAKLTTQENTSIHASIAGGRKTMAFYLGYAMSLLGRSQDRLSHVFVNEELEFVRDFWFPTKEDNWVTGKNGQGEVNCKDGEITLAEIPFVRMRNSLDSNIIESIIHTSFCKQVSKMNQYFDNDFELSLNIATKSLDLLGVSIKLTPKEFSFYWWLYNEGKEGFLRTYDAYDDKNNVGRYLSYYIQVSTDSRTFTTFGACEEAIEKGDYSKIENGMPNDWFEQNLSKINSKIEVKLPVDVANQIKIDSKWEEQGPRSRRSAVNVYATNVNVSIVEP